MITLLIVSDNRFFIRQVYPLVQNNLDITVRVAFHSTAVFEAYLEQPADVILVDAGTLIPYPSIVEQFSEYQWNSLFLVANDQNAKVYEPRDNVIFVDIERDNLYQVMSGNLHAQSAPLLPDGCRSLTGDDGAPFSELDLYYLMLAVCLVPQNESRVAPLRSKLQSRLSAIGKVEVITFFERDVLILMKKSTMKRTDLFREAQRMISETAYMPYSALCCERLALHAVDDACLKLVTCAPLCYCVGARCLSLFELAAIRKAGSCDAVYPFFVQLIERFLQGDEAGMVATLREFYLNWVREAADLRALRNFHTWQAFFESTLLQQHIPQVFPKDLRFGSADQECEMLCAYWSGLLRLYSQAPFLPVVEMGIHELLTRYDDPTLSLETLADRIGFAKAYVSRIFKEQTGLTLIEFLQRLRLQHASCLLRETNLAVKEIARRTGYSDAQYFSKTFRRNLNFHPSDFRSLQRQGDPYACINS